jgi:hypothetical protein
VATRDLGIAGPAASFTPAWRAVQTSGGGALTQIHVYSDGTILTTGDSYGAWSYSSSGSVARDGTTYAVPAWALIATSDSLPSGDVNASTAYSGNTTAWALAAAPSNTSVMYMAYNNKLYYSINRGATWNSSGVTETFNPNGNYVPGSALAVDPINPDVAYFVTLASGVKTTTAGSIGGSWSLISTATIPASPSGKSGNVLFDSSAGTTVGKTNRILISVVGSGVYESTNAGSSWTHITAGSPPTNVNMLSVDSFGVVWAVEGFLGTAGIVYKYSGGSWSTVTGASIAILSVFQNPLFVGIQADNQLLACTTTGQITSSLDNGATWVDTASGSNLTLGSSGAQPAWLNVANQYDSSGNLNLNLIQAGIDTSGKIWAATGIDVFTTPVPITGGSRNTTLAWAANTLGIDQLVSNQITSPPGIGPWLSVWDRGIFPIGNPDTPATFQFLNSNNISSPFAKGIINPAWGQDFVAGTQIGAVCIAQNATLIAKTVDGGQTWTPTTNNPASMGFGCTIACSTTSNWISNSVQNASALMYYTTDSGATWNPSTLNGSPGGIVTNFSNNRQVLAADRVTAGTFYFVDVNQKFFISINNGATFNAAATSGVTGGVQSDQLKAMPMLGSTNTAGYVFYVGQVAPLYRSINGCGSFSICNASMDKVVVFGFGAPKPGSGAFATIYAYQASGGTAAQGLYQSQDAGTTWTACNIPVSELWPYRVMDLPTCLTGDTDVYGRVWISFRNSGAAYIDTADATPWVKLSNIKPTQALTGAAVTLTAKSSGLVPVTNVKFILDLAGANTQIGATLTGPGPFSVSFNASGQTVGAHTLSVVAMGANGTSTSTIPITTS